jgi:hypothetical protein
MDEKLIAKQMKLLGLSREEAIQLIEDDERIDKGEKLFDLSKEQEKASKQARSVERKVTAYKFDTSKREKKKNPDKEELVSTMIQALSDSLGIAVDEVANPEREFVFHFHDTKYKVVLSAPRK